MNRFTKYKASQMPYKILKACGNNTIYPYLRDENGEKRMWSVSAEHGRSFVVDKTGNNRYIITKGNGLSYSSSSFLKTGEVGDDTWGLLLLKDAVRDFTLGLEISGLGIKTNKMEYVMELQCEIQMPDGSHIKPIILQYSVECPYRISDAPFMYKEDILNEVSKWESLNINKRIYKHQVAADILIRNLNILHSNKVLHNAIHVQNYTWALELLDFELACSPATPYDNEDYQRHVVDLYPREIIHTYQVINYISNVLHEPLNFQVIDKIYSDHGFNISKYSGVILNPLIQQT